jgi:hypothetical protein
METGGAGRTWCDPTTGDGFIPADEVECVDMSALVPRCCAAGRGALLAETIGPAVHLTIHGWSEYEVSRPRRWIRVAAAAMARQERERRKRVRKRRKRTWHTQVIVKGEVHEKFLKRMATRGVNVIRIQDATTA